MAAKAKVRSKRVPRITAADMRDYVRRAFARNGLTISIVGDIDAKTAGALIDRAFAGLPAKDDLKPVANASPRGLGRRIVINLDVPQAVVTFGGPGLARHDPDFMAGYIVNHILGGGTFSSRLYQEVREKRGLAYGVSDSLVWFRRAAVVLGGTATRADRTADALAIVEAETKRMAENGPTPTNWRRRNLSSRAPMRSRSTPRARSRPSSPRSSSTISASTISRARRHDRRGRHRRRQARGQAAL